MLDIFERRNNLGIDKFVFKKFRRVYFKFLKFKLFNLKECIFIFILLFNIIKLVKLVVF